MNWMIVNQDFQNRTTNLPPLTFKTATDAKGEVGGHLLWLHQTKEELPQDNENVGY